MQTNQSKATLIHALIIVILAAAVYGNTLNAPFEFDDSANIGLNPAIRHIPSYFDDPMKQGAKPAIALFFKSRYIGYLSFALNYKYHGLDLAGYHVFNIAAHAATSLLIYLIVSMTFKTPIMARSSLAPRGRTIALIAALIFAAHPINTQAVTYIVQRFTSLCAMFSLLSFALYIKFRLSEGPAAKWASYAFSLCSMILAMFTKEIAFTAPLLIVAYEFIFFDGPIGRRTLYLIPLVLAMLIVPFNLYVTIKDYVTVGESFQWTTRLQSPLTRIEYFATEMRVIATYLRLLILPINQNLDYDYTAYKSLSALPVVLSMILHFVLLAASAFLIKKYRKAEPALAFMGFGIAWFYLTLSVESSIIPIKDVIFEHRVYLPAFGFISAAVIGVAAMFKDSSKRTMTAAAVIGAVIIMGFAVATYARNNLWKSEMSLWSDVVKKSPQKGRALNNLGNAYVRLGMQDEGLSYYQKAVMLDPEMEDVYYNLSLIYQQKGKTAELVGFLESLVSSNPGSLKPLVTLADLYQATGKTAEAARAYEEAIKLDPNDIMLHLKAAEILRLQKNYEAALGHYKSALRISSMNSDAIYYTGEIYVALNRPDDAISYLELLNMVNPSYQVHEQLSKAYRMKGMMEKAKEHEARAAATRGR